MSVNKKRKRKIIVDEKVYWWFVVEEGYGVIAHIISDDKAFIAEYRLNDRVLWIYKSSKGKCEIDLPLLEERYLGIKPHSIKHLIKVGLGDVEDV